MNIFVFARLHARHGKKDEVQQAMFDIHTRWLDLGAFERHAELPHTVHSVETVE